MSRRIERRLILASILTGTFMNNVNATAVTVALPAMAHEFGTSLNDLQWIVTGYFLAITAILPIFGQIAEVIGRKLVLSTGLAIFVVASLLAALAPTFEVLVGCRVLQGLGASMFMATATAAAVTTFSFDQRGRILGVVGAVVAAGTLLGPALGGVLTAAFGWRSIFLSHLPIGLLGVIGTVRLMPAESSSGGSLRQLDLIGSLLFAGFSGSLLLGLAAGPSSTWANPTTLLLLLTTLMFLVLFVTYERRVLQPLIELKLFLRRTFGLGNLAAFLCKSSMLFPALLFPLYLVEVVSISIGVTGLLITLQAMAMLLVSPLAGWWSDRVGSRLPSLVGLGILLVAMLITAFLRTSPHLWLVGLILVLLGAGIGFFSSPNNSAVMGDLGAEQAGTANVVIATLRNLAKALGVALAVVAYQIAAGTTATAGAPAPVFLAGFRGVFLTGALLTAGAALAVLLMYPRAKGRTDVR